MRALTEEDLPAMSPIDENPSELLVLTSTLRPVTILASLLVHKDLPPFLTYFLRGTLPKLTLESLANLEFSKSSLLIEFCIYNFQN